MNPNVKKQFDAAASQYDAQRRGLIPCYDDFYGMAVALAESAEASPRVLDLGAGTGLMAAMVRSKLPAARLSLIDMSESMLDIARERFAGDPNAAFIAADYSDYTFAPGSYDIIVSSLSIHHLTHASKRELFKKTVSSAGARRRIRQRGPGRRHDACLRRLLSQKMVGRDRRQRLAPIGHRCFRGAAGRRYQRQAWRSARLDDGGRISGRGLHV
ncbi:class I SAM-dependent methyltransferase [Cohnella ginsengisoli]|uniref:Class I SAM-dependent methyltransferase n=1 Tax=Cohnella ginsengisoli TaxID=425004 RepID=A0A9X4KLX0_9BACL|nr:class I SAM-dependent methyltransferase [Cohnella ginsengisoli]MDG0794321.1 class I SAM-dependent methyltransferase [Cohnella ginsengisoli]